MHIRAVGSPDIDAIPKAANAALRSSIITFISKAPCLLTATANGALREPGDTTTCFTPWWARRPARITHESWSLVSSITLGVRHFCRAGGYTSSIIDPKSDGRWKSGVGDIIGFQLR